MNHGSGTVLSRSYARRSGPGNGRGVRLSAEEEAGIYALTRLRSLLFKGRTEPRTRGLNEDQQSQESRK